MPGLTRVAIALGSNLGNRAAHLQFAAGRLSSILSGPRLSSFHDTAPVGGAPQPRFLNAAMSGATALDSRQLLRELLTIEGERDRARPFPDAPRTLDLDLILFGEEKIEEADLIVPHPRFRDRRFVLAPLTEVAGDWIDPVTRSTIAELHAQLEARERRVSKQQRRPERGRR